MRGLVRFQTDPANGFEFLRKKFFGSLTTCRRENRRNVGKLLHLRPGRTIWQTDTDRYDDQIVESLLAAAGGE